MKSNIHQINSPCRPLFIAVGLAMALLVFNAQPAQACSACTNNAVQIKIPGTATGILQALHEHDAVLNQAIRGKQLRKVSLIVLAMNFYAKGLPAKAPAEQRISVTDALNGFRKSGKDLLKAALAEDQPAAADRLNQFEASLKGLDALFNYKT